MSSTLDTVAQALLAAKEGKPFTFAGTTQNLNAFESGLQNQGQAIEPTSAANPNSAFNQYLQNVPGGASAENQAGITTQSSNTATNPSFSWLDPWPWLKSEAGNILLIIIGVIVVVIVLMSIFDMSPSDLMGESSGTLASAAGALAVA